MLKMFFNDVMYAVCQNRMTVHSPERMQTQQRNCGKTQYTYHDSVRVKLLARDPTGVGVVVAFSRSAELRQQLPEHIKPQHHRDQNESVPEQICGGEMAERHFTYESS